ncbi:hypothetical protein BDV3_005941 [Batrachochytrium dendrobatidis]|nr:hypothetical protein QVD99_006848 [Batrachochytrium dendrobatidis]
MADSQLKSIVIGDQQKSHPPVHSVKFSHRISETSQDHDDNHEESENSEGYSSKKTAIVNISEDHAKGSNMSDQHHLNDSASQISYEDRLPKGVMKVNRSMSSSLTSQYPYAREISETLSSKITQMRWCGLALAVNSICIYYVCRMSGGIEFPLPYTVVTSIGCVIIELVLLISNILTLRALDDGVSAWFGARLTEKKGFSLCICGFFQALPFQKWSFANQLSLNSTCRSLFARISIIWILLEMMKWLTPISATAMSGESVKIDSGTVECISYLQAGSPVDRLLPNLQGEAGYAELVFGSAMGNLQSEKDVNETVFMMSPQIIGAVNDGDTIIGPGFVTSIHTSCLCSTKNSTQLQSLGLSSSAVTDLLSNSATLGFNVGFASNVDLSDSTSNIKVQMLFTGVNVCGGQNATLVPLCTSVISNHSNAVVVVEYMTDGTTASVAPRSVDVRSVGSPADMQTWLSAALVSILGGQSSSVSLAPTVPGVLNPLLWWTSPDLMAVDPSRIESGVETMIAILLRGGIQRTYTTRGSMCNRNVALVTKSIVKMAQYGISVALFILFVQLLFTLIAILAFIPWIMCSSPIGAGVRAIREPVYFTTLLNSSSVCQGFDQLCNAQLHSIWQHLDVVVRIGEPIGSSSEVIGRISMDRPKLITWMTNGKKYF